MNLRALGLCPNGSPGFFLFLGPGVSISNGDLLAMRDASAEEDARFAADYGFAASSFSVVDSLSQVPDRGVPCGLFNGLDDPTAAAFHTRTKGWPSISVDASLSLKETQIGLSHEVKELRYDPLATSYTTRIMVGGLVLDSNECCDAIQGRWRQTSNGVWVSEHLTQWWFGDDSNPPGVKLTSLETDPIENPGDVDAEGYKSTIDVASSKIVQVNAMKGLPFKTSPVPKHPASRGGKRLEAMRKHVLLLGAAVLAIVALGCSAAAGIVGAAGTIVCDAVSGIVWGGISVGSICSGISSLVQGILDAIPATSDELAAKVASVPQDFTFQGTKIGTLTLPPRVAALLAAKLKAAETDGGAR